MSDNQPSLAIGALAISADGKTIFAGTGEPNQQGFTYFGAGLLKSSDAGHSWTVLGASYFTGGAISKIILSSSNPSRILVSLTWAVCCNGFYTFSLGNAYGVYLSNDGGVTWTQTLQPMVSSTDASIIDMVADPVNPSVVYAGDMKGSIWVSKDAGQTWAVFQQHTDPTQQNRVALAMTPAAPGILYAAFGDSAGELIGIYRTDTSSLASSALGYPPNSVYGKVTPCGGGCWYDLFLAADPSNSSIIYLGGTDLYTSTNGGRSWTDLETTGSTHPHEDTHAFALSPTNPTLIYLGDDGGVWRSSDRGSDWTNLNAQLGITQFYSITVSPNGPATLLGGTQDNGCVEYTGSSAWTQVVGADGGWSGFEKTNPRILYCNYVHLTFVRSTDGGQTWFHATNGIDLSESSRNIAPVAQDPSAPGTLYIAGTHVYKTTNYAQSWSVVGGPFDANSIVYALAVAPSNDMIIYAATTSGALYISSNGGSSWQLAYSLGASGSYTPVAGIVVDPANPFSVYVSVPRHGLFLVHQQGGEWQSTPLQTPVFGCCTTDTNVIRIDSSSGWLYAGTDNGVYVSEDSGSSWQQAGSGLPNVAVFDIAVSPAGQVFAATHGRGVWTLNPNGPATTTTTISSGSSATSTTSSITTSTVTSISTTLTTTSASTQSTISSANSTATTTVPPVSVTTQSATTTSTASSSFSTAGGGGIPEFPLQMVVVTVFTASVVVSYFLVRRHPRLSRLRT